MRSRARRAGLVLWLLGVSLLGVAAGLWNVFPFDAGAIDAYPASAWVLDRDGRVLRVYASSAGEMRFPARLADVSPWVIQATVAVEDRRFASHAGVDLLAVTRALAQNVCRGAVHSGASTITMQLVRLLEPRPRNLTAKAVEAFRALQVEARLTKPAILEAYLNLAPYGGNLRGVEAAAQRFFAKSARDLTLGEAALLAGLPQSPSRLRPDRHYERALARRGQVLDAMLSAGCISASEHAAAAVSRPEVRAHPWPFHAPHAADMALRERAAAKPAGLAVRARTASVRSTIDSRAQASAEAHLGAALDAASRRFANRALSSAVVVADVETGAVRALVGSPDFFDVPRRGQVNMATARRSPGSALKPFLYALAYDRGAASSSTYLADVPAGFSGFTPENFDRRFAGPIAAGEALARSLNLPALRLQERVGTRTFLDLLRAFGFETLDAGARHYGLTLCLGGGEVRLLDLAGAFADLVRLGVHLPVHLCEAADPGNGTRVVSRAAALSVLEDLSASAHIDRAGSAGTALRFRWGYKTGTSYGLRDAWAVAFSARVVVAVWLGHARGGPSPDLVGLDAAVPLAVAVLADVAAGSPAEWPGGGELKAVTVCAASGYPAGVLCPVTKESRAAPGVTLPACPVHREILVNAESGREVCNRCGTGHAVERRVVEVWPDEVAAWLAENGSPVRPAHEAGCPRWSPSGAPRILTPAPGDSFLVFPGSTLRQRLFLAAAAARDAERLSWFVDGAFLTAAPAGEKVSWALRPGPHEVRCVDDRGRAARVRFRVEPWRVAR